MKQHQQPNFDALYALSKQLDLLVKEENRATEKLQQFLTTLNKKLDEQTPPSPTVQG